MGKLEDWKREQAEAAQRTLLGAREADTIDANLSWLQGREFGTNGRIITLTIKWGAECSPDEPWEIEAGVEFGGQPVESGKTLGEAITHLVHRMKERAS